MEKTLFLLPLLLAACGTPAPAPEPAPVAETRMVNVYSHRHYDVDKQLFTQFTEKTGIQVNVIQAGDDEIMARLEQEGEKSPCDIFITADAGRLGLARSRGLLQPTKSEVLDANIPAALRDPEGYWFGLTMRARVIAFNKEKVKPEQIHTYADLTAAKWKGKVLVRSSENVYNQSLLAAMIAHDGPEAAEAWAKGIVANMAREPKGGDTDQLLAIAEGIGDVAIANSYYIGKLMASDEPEKQKAKGMIGVLFPTMGAHGTHANVSGGGIAKYAPNPSEAMALLEFLSGDEAQKLFAEGNKEYPVKPGIAPAPELAAFGTFTPDSLNLEALARFNAEAVKRFDAAGWR
ncbi:MAG TPA: Fe(3+) ABC transporter substrate-binding protein [Flavobacteriales bacterium]|nr:Fe(3+) ABC transporter substrate-binding protein [Flavobacteriales bacterium]